MRHYATTEQGNNIAQESGLKDLADRLLQEDEQDELTLSLSDPYYAAYEDEDQLVGIRAGQAYRLLKDSDHAEFARGLKIDERQSWRRLTASPGGLGLFSDLNIDLPAYMPASSEDSLVLSGLVGFQYRNRRNQSSLLTRYGYQDYGFRSYIDSLAFVGAYVIDRFTHQNKVDDDVGDAPSFWYEEAGIRHQILVGGDMSGDLRIKERCYAAHDITSPLYTSVEYSPQTEIIVGAYHSTEPELTFAMLQYAWLHKGQVGLRSLIDAFGTELSTLANEDGSISFEKANFANYGDRDLRHMIGRFAFITDEFEVSERMRSSERLHVDIYGPQGNRIFEIMQNHDGLVLQNRDNQTASIGPQIAIPYSGFSDFFRTIINQAQAALGRTGPMQHVQIVQGINKLIGDK